MEDQKKLSSPTTDRDDAKTHKFAMNLFRNKRKTVKSNNDISSPKVTPKEETGVGGKIIKHLSTNKDTYGKAGKYVAAGAAALGAGYAAKKYLSRKKKGK